MVAPKTWGVQLFSTALSRHGDKKLGFIIGYFLGVGRVLRAVKPACPATLKVTFFPLFTAEKSNAS